MTPQEIARTSAETSGIEASTLATLGTLARPADEASAHEPNIARRRHTRERAK